MQELFTNSVNRIKVLSDAIPQREIVLNHTSVLSSGLAVQGLNMTFVFYYLCMYRKDNWTFGSSEEI